MLGCVRCERGRVMWAGDEYQCIQCGWVASEDDRGRPALPGLAARAHRPPLRSLAAGRASSPRTTRRRARTPQPAAA